jgi:hypothetical protein
MARHWRLQLIDYRQGPDPAPIEERIGYEIHAPALVGPLQLVRRGLVALGVSAAQMHPFQAVKVMNAPVIVGPALPAQ